MSIYRRYRSLFLGFATLLLAAGCNPPEESSALSPRTFEVGSVTQEILAGANNASPLPEIIDPNLTATRPWRIAFISKEPRVDKPTKVNDVFWYSAWLGLQETAQLLNVQAENYSVSPDACEIHNECVLPQINAVNQLIEAGEVDGLVFAPTDSFRLAAVVDKAVEAGLPVVAMDTPVDTDSVLSFVVLDSYESAKQMGQWVNGQLDGQGNVLILTGPQTDQNATDRHRGLLAGLGGSDITVLDTENTNWLESRGQEITADWLDEFSNIDAILSGNDATALGAIAAIQAAGREGILVAGYDGLPPAMDAIRAGEMAATIYQNPALQAEIATRLLVQHLEEGSTFPPVVFVPGSPLVTAQNIEAKQ